jgi:enolase
MMNIMNGGAHAANNLEIQEFMIAPVGIRGFSEQLRAGAEIYKALGKILNERGYSTSVGDEGGYAPNLTSDEAALDLITEAIHKAGYDESMVKLALDVAASGWFEDGGYTLSKSGKRLSADELIDYYTGLTQKYSIFSIEDGLGEEDYEGWKRLTERLSSRVLLVGDDLFVTNRERLRMGLDLKIANTILIKPNQIGSLSETLDVISLAKNAGYSAITSHRSGDTEDSFIADLAVAMGTKYIKSGAPCRSERLAKYNRLLKIEKELSENQNKL